MPIRAPRRQNCAGQFGQTDELDFQVYRRFSEMTFLVLTLFQQPGVFTTHQLREVATTGLA